MKKHLKGALRIFIIVVTIAAFAYYVATHPETVEQLKRMPIALLFGLLAIYAISFLAYVAVTRGSLDMFEKKLPRQENILFNAYSTLVNFFAPGQSGPAFRAIYLKKRHDLPIKKFVFATLLYLAFYAVLSLLLIGIGVLVWWQTLIILLAATAGCVAALQWYKKRSEFGKSLRIPLRSIAWIGVATAVQVLSIAFIYGAELRSIDPSITPGQILAYTGVANLALFVSITPGGIGIRESFLFISQGLHNIPDTTIVAASIIDRAVYLLFLGLLFLLVIGLHAKDKLHVNQMKTE